MGAELGGEPIDDDMEDEGGVAELRKGNGNG